MTDNNEVFKIILNLEEKLRNLFKDICDFERQVKELKKKLSLNSLMPFGKYQGLPLNEVPESYIMWLFANDALDQFEYRELRKELKNLYKDKLNSNNEN